MTEYEKQAQDFLDATQTTITKEFVKYDTYFEGDKDKRNIRQITLTNKYGTYTFTYGDSVFNSDCKENLPKDLKIYKVALSNAGIHDKESYKQNRHKLKLVNELSLVRYFHTLKIHTPSDYDILACLDVFDGDFQDFCDCFWYDNDSISANNIYKKVVEQSNGLRKIFDRKEIEMLQEI